MIATLGGRRHWRALTPEQEASVRSSVRQGASPRYLATAYSVALRTIYRTIERGERTIRIVELAGFRATFEVDEGDAPVQVTPWVPA